MVDPAGLEPAPYGLKGRFSATRVPGQDICDCQLPIGDLSRQEGSPLTPIGNRQSKIGNAFGCGGRIRTFGGRINNPVPYQLGYATRDRDRETEGRGDAEKESLSPRLPISTSPRP